jgi:hypothetical protein
MWFVHIVHTYLLPSGRCGDWGEEVYTSVLVESSHFQHSPGPLLCPQHLCVIFRCDHRGPGEEVMRKRKKKKYLFAFSGSVVTIADIG